jgi:hypothetical protein
VADEARKKKKKQRMKAIYGFMILRNEKKGKYKT